MGEYGESNVARPHGPVWNARRKSVMARQRVCVYCGRVPVKPHVAHLIPLVEGTGLRVSTSNIHHPLNAPENLAMACDFCNITAGGLSIAAARRKIAAKLGLPEYRGAIPDVTMVQAKLDALAATQPTATASSAHRPAYRPDILGQDAPSASSKYAYNSVAEAVADLHPLTEGTDDYKLVARMIGDGMPCTPGDNSPGRCFECMWNIEADLEALGTHEGDW